MIVNFRKVIDRIDSLPTLSPVANQIAAMVNDPGSDAKKIAAVLRNDPALTAKVLKLVNSPYYAIPGGVSDVSTAISFLGFNTLYQLVLSVSVLSVLSTKNEGDLSPFELWKYSVGCATMGEILADHVMYPETSICFTAGLLHDIGKIALMRVAPEKFQEAVTIAREQDIPLNKAALDAGLPNHQTVGSRLAEKWRFPMPLRIAINYQRYLTDSSRSTLARNMGIFVDITAMADIMVRSFKFGDAGDDILPEVDETLMDRMRVTEEDFPVFEEKMHDATQRSKIILELASE